ncbi:hypothetical protein Catovirus_1_669 [Catovirus CTV1]|uniref:Uncharacterized protein n=1 Tax=Catovirus CTV1 TaxID=1977631 RepID=A0A1V0SA92_9VIRU|nr:hypothetical protein Catovirus_1_669 [Catovirus CTV1]
METTQDYHDVIKFIVPENKIKEETIISPSGNYKLIVEYYRSCYVFPSGEKSNSIFYTCGLVFKTNNDELVCKIPRSSCDFNHKFFTKNQEEWLVTGMTATTMTFVNLDKGQIYHNIVEKKTDLYWADWHFSLDGNTIAVEPYTWCGIADLRFFDITDISKGWYQLDQPECPDYSYVECNKDNTFTLYNIGAYKKLGSKYYSDYDDEYDTILQNTELSEVVDSWYVFERQGNKMVIKSEWILEDRLRWEKINNSVKN